MKYLVDFFLELAKKLGPIFIEIFKQKKKQDKRQRKADEAVKEKDKPKAARDINDMFRNK